MWRELIDEDDKKHTKSYKKDIFSRIAKHIM